MAGNTAQKRKHLTDVAVGYAKHWAADMAAEQGLTDDDEPSGKHQGMVGVIIPNPPVLS